MQVEGRHVPNLLIAEKSNDGETYIFDGPTPLGDFLDWLNDLANPEPNDSSRSSEDNDDSTQPPTRRRRIQKDTQLLTFIAHNFQGYDSYPIIDELHQRKQ